MNSLEHRPVRTALIPWVIALFALFGVNTLVPDHSRSRRSDAADEIGISQLADNAQAPGRTFHPLVFLVPDSSDGVGFLNPASLSLRVETHRNLPLAQSVEGAVHGRAPPVMAIS